MKFITAVVMLALACSTQSSVVPLSSWGLSPLGLSPLGLQLAGSPLALNPLGVPITSRLLTPEAISLNQGIPSAISLAHGIPSAISLNQGLVLPAARIIAAPVEGSYVAANRGSVHVAPLPGHLQSASSLNLEPAPGTW